MLAVTRRALVLGRDSGIIKREELRVSSSRAAAAECEVESRGVVAFVCKSTAHDEARRTAGQNEAARGKDSILPLCDQLDDATGFLDLPLGLLAEEPCPDDEWNLWNPALAQHLGVAQRQQIQHRHHIRLGARLAQEFLSLLRRHQ